MVTLGWALAALGIGWLVGEASGYYTGYKDAGIEQRRELARQRATADASRQARKQG